MLMWCPVCGKKLYRNSWYGEFGLEEFIYDCRKGCGKYTVHWSYGRQKLRIWNFEAEFTCHNFMTNEEDIKIAEKNWYIFYQYLNYFKKRKQKCR